MKIALQLLIAAGVFVGSVVACAAGGGLLGKMIATWYPQYYPTVFASLAERKPDFDAAQVGIGMGIGQGAIAGLFVGAVIVLALALANHRRNSRAD